MTTRTARRCSLGRPDFDTSPESVELVFEGFVTPVDVSAIEHDRLTLGAETAQDQRGTGADVRCPNGCTRKSLHPPDHCVMTFDADVRAHSIQFVDEQKTGLEHVFGEDRRTIRLREENHHRRLQIGRKPWVWKCYEIERAGSSRHRNPNAIGQSGDFGTSLLKLDQRELDVFGFYVSEDDVATCCGRPDSVGTGVFPG